MDKRLSIDDAINKMDIAVNVAIEFQNLFGKDITGIWHLEDLENLSNEEIDEHINDIYENFSKYHILVFSGYVFTKHIVKEIYSFYNYTLDKGYYVILLIEYPLMIVTKNKDDYKLILSKLGKNQIKESSLNLKDAVFSDNGVELHYFSHNNTKLFERKPETMENDFEKDDE